MGGFWIAGPRAVDKARCDLDAWIKRTRRHFAEQGIADYRGVSLAVIGAEDIYGPHARGQHCREVMARYGVHHDDRRALEFAAAELASQRINAGR